MKIQTAAAIGLLLIAVSGCSGAVSQTPTGSAAAAPSATSAASVSSSGVTNATPITERDFKIDTPDITVTGESVSLAVTNAGPTVHDLTIRDAAGSVLAETKDLKPGTSETVTVKLPAGTYTIFCALPGHESLGLKGTLTVRG